MLQLAECYLQDKAAKWIMRLERHQKKPVTVEELETALIKEFVPPNEVALAKVALMEFKKSESIDKHIMRFQELVELCDTPLSEAYTFFFKSLPTHFKEELTKKYPTSEPDSMLTVYENVRTLDLSRRWADKDEEQKSSTKGESSAGKRDSSQGGKYGKYDKGNGGRGSKAGHHGSSKSDTTLSWGPVKPGEHTKYRAADRCMKCGEKGWSDTAHPCRKEWEQKRATGQTSPKA